MNHFTESTKHVLDAASIVTILATLSAWLPPLAALASLIWGLIRIFETRTVQAWLKARRDRRG